MTKKILVFLLFTVVFAPSTFAQHTLSDNLPYYDASRFHLGFYLGLNWYDFKLAPTTKGMTNDGALGIETEVFTGFSVGGVIDYKLNDYFNIRLEPGVDLSKRELFYHRNVLDNYYDHGYPDPNMPTEPVIKQTTINDSIRNITSTYFNIPILLKFGGKRRHNIRPYIIGGINFSYDHNSNENSHNNNTNGVDGFRMKTFNYAWQAGVGIDWYLKYFKFSTEIRGSFGINDELIKDNIDINPPESGITPWTDPIDKLQTRAVFFVLKFE